MQRFGDNTHHPIILFVGIGPIIFRVTMSTGRFCQMSCTMVLIYKMPTEQFPVGQKTCHAGLQSSQPCRGHMPRLRFHGLVKQCKLSAANLKVHTPIAQTLWVLGAELTHQGDQIPTLGSLASESRFRHAANISNANCPIALIVPRALLWLA